MSDFNLSKNIVEFVKEVKTSIIYDNLSLYDRNLIEEILEMNETMKKKYSELDKTRKKISLYTMFLIVCCLTFLEILFYYNIISLIIAPILGFISFLFIERENNRGKKIRIQINELKRDINKKILEIQNHIS